MPGRVVIEWDKSDCEDMGIVKVDLLGLGMMAVLEESLAVDIREFQSERVILKSVGVNLAIVIIRPAGSGE